MIILPVINTIPHAMISTTTVRIAVARFEFTPSTPILARMEVSAAKSADSSAYKIHICFTYIMYSIGVKRIPFTVCSVSVGTKPKRLYIFTAYGEAFTAIFSHPSVAVLLSSTV